MHVRVWFGACEAGREVAPGLNQINLLKLVKQRAANPKETALL